jgi:hypothetical protein
MTVVIVFVVLAVVVFVVSAPLRAARKPEDPRAARVAELEAARDAKYAEIREAELDHRTGKLSEADYETVDAALRAEAIEILHRLDEAHGAAVSDGAGAGPGAGNGAGSDQTAKGAERAATIPDR